MPSFDDVLRARLSRRRLLAGGLATAGLGLLGPAAVAQGPLLGFTGVPASSADALVVPPGYLAQVLYAWGDPISDGPAFRANASSTAADQLRQAGMHHDGMHFFPLPAGTRGSSHGLLAINHEYADDGLLHPDGMRTWTAEKVRKSQAAHGVSVIEVRLAGGRWDVVRPSRYARRITAATPMGLDGPAVGHAWMRTAADPDGRLALGTISNCAMGHTPWGTYLTCEENFQFYFVNRSGSVPPGQRRYGITGRGGGYRWHEHDERFDAARHANEPHRFGWVVELDPFDPRCTPLKRTALGRFKHEGAALAVAADRRVVFYMGDDERFEYVYKFVSRDPCTSGGPAANATVLERGTLYAARFDPDGTGTWLALAPGQNGLDAAAGFPTQAEI
ncbi:MAG TPA: alkaline phosphatase PhoX, partial [Methylomirabilota bacterium]|nr:alkaline phosphatase PhoX [Methylomirabilota bacterium]